MLPDWCLCLAVFRAAVPGVDSTETDTWPANLHMLQFAALLLAPHYGLEGMLACFRLTGPILWVMPGLQLGLLMFFLAVAVLHFWYNWWLLVPCFITGTVLFCNHPVKECT